MDVLRKLPSLALFIVTSSLAVSIMAMGGDGEEVKESAPDALPRTAQEWRDIVGARINQAQPDLPLDLARLIANYLFVPPLKIAAGSFHSLAVRDGQIWIWGCNQDGQLGDGTKTDRSTPWALPLDGHVTRVALGRWHTLALTDKGVLYAWGSNSFGVLGNGSEVHSLKPIRVKIETDIDQIAAGYYHSLALTCEGQVLAWGSHGVSGYNEKSCRRSFTPQPVELPVEPNDLVIKIAARGCRSLALTRNGRVFIWGERCFEPQEIPIKGAVQIAAGYDFFLALTDQGKVWAWGKNNYRQLGNGSEKSSSTPVCADIPGFIVKIAAGFGHALALTNEGEVFSWGVDCHGQLGMGDNGGYLKPTLVFGLFLKHRVVEIDAGGQHSLALTEHNEIFAWGYNGLGELGIGTLQSSRSPIRVQLPDISSENPAEADDGE